ncbi:MAG: tetraacyldisaccharide 4'-kinase [Deltaproteobacteria bacterium]|nr:tetraacyldisaccharide 4'-kinase [Deltaproteobacteria bacterium]
MFNLRSHRLALKFFHLKPGLWFAPFAPLFASAVLLRRWGYNCGLLSATKLPVLTIAIGGLEAGGSGKTPVTALLLEALLATGRHPGLLTRGYKRPQSDLQVHRRGTVTSPELIGDEAAMLVASGLNIDIAACPSRRKGAQALLNIGVDCLVLDDGFQHRALARDLDIVVLRGEQPFGNGHLLPWGTLREPVSSLNRAQIIWLHYRDATQLESIFNIKSNYFINKPKWLHTYAKTADLVISLAVPAICKDISGNEVSLHGKSVIAAAAIAKPKDFFNSLVDIGAHVVKTNVFVDHHRYRIDDVSFLLAQIKNLYAETVVVTPKDAVKLAPIWPADVPLWVLGTQPKIVSGADIIAKRLEIPLTKLSNTVL